MAWIADLSDTSRYLPIPHPVWRGWRSIRYLPILADTITHPSHPVSVPQVSSPALVGGGKNPLFLLLPYVNHNTQPEVLLLAGRGVRRVHRPTAHTTQPPKITKNLNLTTKTPQNEEKEYIFVIYALRLATKYILRIF
jgi:hypothetical protein